MNLVDDRTPEQRQTHKWLVVATHKFMSGWGEARGGVSYAAWDCTEETYQHVLKWVEARKEMKRVRLVYGEWRPRGNGHAHIYAVESNHVSLPSWMRNAVPV